MHSQSNPCFRKAKPLHSLATLILILQTAVPILAAAPISNLHPPTSNLQPPPSTPQSPTATTTLYVDRDAPGPTYDGLSWTTAYTTVQNALDVTNVYSTTDYEIWVAAGVYYPDEGAGRIDNDPTQFFTLSYDNVQLYGGFDPSFGAETWAARDWETYPTVLSGDIDGNDTSDPSGIVTSTAHISGTNAYHLLWLDGVTNEPISTTTVIDGFTITAGQAIGSYPDNTGGGIHCDGAGSGHACSPTLSHLTFSGNQASGSGGGMANYGSSGGTSSPVLTGVTFTGNWAGFMGGGMFNGGDVGNSSPILTNVTFSGNQAFWNGGGMFNRGDAGNSSPILTNVTFSGNQADYGGGMYNSGYGGNSSPTLIGVTFSNNQATYGGGAIHFFGDNGDVSAQIVNGLFDSNGADHIGYDDGNVDTQPHFINCTFSGATTQAVFIEWWDSGRTPIDFTNVIFWGNNEDITNNDGAVNVQYSIVEESAYAAGTGNVHADPQFVDAASSDYRLLGSSPAIDAGNNAAVPPGITTDLADNPRFVDRPTPDTGSGTPPIVDMGAYEARYTPPDIYLPLVLRSYLAAARETGVLVPFVADRRMIL